ncbi:MAG TPA: hypothetical protein DCX07_08725 [Phycisphaerales bacterium]|nr:hypothetical protein [Phycisphaerales bacterium]
MEDVYIVMDGVLGGLGSRNATLRWRLGGEDWVQVADGLRGRVGREDFRVLLLGPSAATKLIVGQESPPEGWESRYYGEKKASPLLLVRAEGVSATAWFVSVFGPAEQVERCSGIRRFDAIDPEGKLVLAQCPEAPWLSQLGELTEGNITYE